MTVIAYRNGLMAADTGARSNDLIRTNAKKVYKCPVTGDLYGFAGNADSMAEFIDWVISETEEDYPHIKYQRRPSIGGNIEKFESHFIVLHVSADGKIVELLTAFGKEDFSKEPYCAIGAGAEVAIGAMYVGATATAAVGAAINHSPYCHGRVMTETLDKNGK